MNLYNLAILLEHKYITSYTMYEDDIKKMIQLASKHRNALVADCNAEWYDKINFGEESVCRNGSKGYHYVDNIEKKIKDIIKKIGKGLYVDFQYDPRGYTVKIRKKGDRKRGLFENSYSGLFFD